MQTEGIKHAYTCWKNAVIKGDLLSLNDIYTENFTWTNSTGVTKNKTENLRRINTGDLRYLSWLNGDIIVDIVGDTAVLRTRENLKLLVYDQKINTVRDVTIIFINEDGQWKVAAGEESIANQGLHD